MSQLKKNGLSKHFILEKPLKLHRKVLKLSSGVFSRCVHIRLNHMCHGNTFVAIIHHQTWHTGSHDQFTLGENGIL